MSLIKLKLYKDQDLSPFNRERYLKYQTLRIAFDNTVILKRHLTDLKTMTNPPIAIRLTVEATIILLNLAQSKLAWNDSKRELTRSQNFLKAVQNLKSLDGPNIPGSENLEDLEWQKELEAIGRGKNMKRIDENIPYVNPYGPAMTVDDFDFSTKTNHSDSEKSNSKDSGLMISEDSINLKDLQGLKDLKINDMKFGRNRMKTGDSLTSKSTKNTMMSTLNHKTQAHKNKSSLKAKIQKAYSADSHGEFFDTTTTPNIENVTLEKLEQLKPYLDHPSFNVRSMSLRSEAAGKLCEFVVNGYNLGKFCCEMRSIML